MIKKLSSSVTVRIPLATTRVTCEILTNPMRKFWGSGWEWVPRTAPSRLVWFRIYVMAKKEDCFFANKLHVQYLKSINLTWISTTGN